MKTLLRGWTVVSGLGGHILFPNGGFNERKEAVAWARRTLGLSFCVQFSRWGVPLIRRLWKIVPIAFYPVEEDDDAGFGSTSW